MNTRYFKYGSLLLAALMVVASAGALRGDESAAQQENELLEALRSDAPEADKAIACKKLAIYGSEKAVPELAKLLPNPRLSSWARISLEAIPGAAADKALREAANSLDGELAVGMINSIGVRRDAGAVDTLAAKLDDADAQVASAAAVALGRIGNAAATKSLREALASHPEIRSAVAEGCVLCAERLWQEDKLAAATEIYDQVRQADVPMQRVIEATRGAILARGQDGVDLLMEMFRSPEKRLFQLALGTAREFPGGEVDKALAEEVAQAAPDRAALIVQAMADRPETVVLSGILKAADHDDKQVRLSAIDALRRVGDDSCLSTLLQIAKGDDAELSQAAKATLSELPGQRLNAKIVALLPTAEGSVYPLLLELVAQRRIDAMSELLRAMDHSDAAVRTAALAALGETVPLAKLDVLVTQAIAPKHPEDGEAARQALRAAAVRMPDREACAQSLAAALDRSPSASKSALLEILAEVGGDKALQTLAAAAKSDDPQQQDTASRLLGVWNSKDAAPVLLDLSKTAPETKYQVRALRGYLGIARKFAMSDKERAEMCRNAINAARRTNERELAFEVLKLHPSLEGLRLAVQASKVPSLKQDATAAAMSIAQKVGGKGVDVDELISAIGLERVKLEIIKAEYGSGSNQKDVTAVLRKYAGDLPLIPLKSESYNASFGGDPSPGVAKELRVEYRINGKAGEATFPENALIVLPVPK